MLLKISILIIITSTACVHRGATTTTLKGGSEPVNLTNVSQSELKKYVGHEVIMQGKFSLLGKLGPFILVGDRPIYVLANDTFSSGPRYESFEGKNVQVLGTLRFAHYEHNSQEASPVAIPTDHFYFEAETTKVELAK